MLKKIFGSLVLIVLIFNFLKVDASSNVKARIGNQFFDTLEEAIEAASSNDIINLTGDVTLSKPMEIKKNVNINLNNHTIQGENQVFLVQGGSLNLTGTGTIRETKPYYGAVMMMGSEDPGDKDYSTLSVSSGVTLEGWSGVFIDHVNNKGYGILVNMNGTIKAVDDIDGGPGAGIYVNGNIKHKDNAPVINLSSTTKITSTGNGIYSAGYATYNINGAYIEGVESALGIKSGIFNINDGVIFGTGEDKTPTSGNNNGINASGTAIQMESNSGYAGDMELYIKNGTIRSKNSNVIYEYTVGSSPTKLSKIELSGGIYRSDANKEVFSLSTDFESKGQDFISGGSYTSNPTNYLKSGYTSSKVGDLYEVTTTTMSVFGSSDGSNNSLVWIISFVFLIIISVILYLKRKNIFDFINIIRNK